MNQLTEDAKVVLRLVSAHIEEQPLTGKLTIWKGLVDLTPEKSQAGLLARHNKALIQEALERQDDFFAALN